MTWRPAWMAVRDVVVFQIAWIIAAMGAARGLSWPGLAAAAITLGMQYAAPERAMVLRLAAVTGLIGLGVESTFVASGAVHYAAAWPTDALAPAWIVALWMAFATTLAATHRALAALSPVKVALLGAALGPASYIAGERLGALTFGPARWSSLALIAALWAVTLPALLAVHTRATRGA